MKCPQPQCKMRGVPEGVRGHLVLVHGFSRTEADALIMGSISDNYSLNGGRNMDGNDIRTARNAAGLTQKELADELGVSDATIYGWENDKWSPTEDREKRLREVLSDDSAASPGPDHDDGEDVDPAATAGCEKAGTGSPGDQEQHESHNSCESEDKQCEECNEPNGGEAAIPTEERSELIQTGFVMGLKHAMLQLKQRAKHKFWQGNINAAVELRRLYQTLENRANSMDID